MTKTEFEQKCDFHKTNGGECHWCNKVIVKDRSDSLNVEFKAYDNGFHEGQEAAFRKVIESLRDDFYSSKLEGVQELIADYLEQNKEKILGDE